MAHLVSDTASLAAGSSGKGHRCLAGRWCDWRAAACEGTLGVAADLLKARESGIRRLPLPLLSEALRSAVT
jgi:hypothetical protein